MDNAMTKRMWGIYRMAFTHTFLFRMENSHLQNWCHSIYYLSAPVLFPEFATLYQSSDTFSPIPATIGKSYRQSRLTAYTRFIKIRIISRIQALRNLVSILLHRLCSTIEFTGLKQNSIAIFVFTTDFHSFLLPYKNYDNIYIRITEPWFLSPSRLFQFHPPHCWPLY